MIDGLTDRLAGREQIDSGACRDHTEAGAERLVTQALEALGLHDESMAHTKKNDERKIRIAALAQKQTLAGNAWIGARCTWATPPESVVIAEVAEEHRSDRPTQAG